MKFIFLVDFDNVPEKSFADAKKLGDDTSVIIFYTQEKSLSLSTLAQLKGVKKDYLKVDPGKEALDKQLCSYLGYLIGQNSKDNTTFVIISNDKGYKCVQSFWNNQEIKNILIFPNAKECDKYFASKKPKSNNNSQSKAKTTNVPKKTEFNNLIQKVLKSEKINGEKLDGNTIGKAASIASSHENDPSKEILDNVCKDLVKEFKQEKGNAIYNIIKKPIREYKKGQ